MRSRTLAPAAAALALGLALILALAQLGAPPLRPEASAREPLQAAGAAVEAGADHVTAPELADLLLAGQARVIDLQTADEFARVHLPQAVHMTLDALLGTPGLAVLDPASAAGAPVVLVSRGMTHAAQAWMALAAQGRAGGVRVLEGGMDGFLREILMPPSLRDPGSPALAPADAVRYDQLRRTMEGTAQAAPGPFAAEPEALAAPGVVTTAWLARRYGSVVVLDGRGKAEDYAAGHLPGARHLPADALRLNRGGEPALDELRPPAELAAIYGALGIGPETEVVAYADAKLHDAAHALIGLIRLGHRRLAILDGGVERWRSEGRPLASGVEAAPVAVNYSSERADDSFIAGLERVIAASGAGTAILDVRPADQFRGEKSTEARAGHIPGSVNRPIALDLDGAAWKSEAELRAGYEALGIDTGSDVVVTCRTGHQAALTWFTLRWLLGVEGARWYDGSWQEWAAHAELPLARGD